MVEREPVARRASPADGETITNIIALSFANDPLWGLAMRRADGRTDHHPAFWALFVAGALRYPWTWLLGDGAATSIWIPPGGTEMGSAQEERLQQLASEQLGESAKDYFELFDRFERAHPRDEPHYYLSLLGTHPDHRGKGLGMWLLAHDLELIDAEHLPAYLESSNAANDHRYARLGFEPVGEVSYPGDGPRVTTMWRQAR
jgi:GNAT superfamily N-acetyltransferase